MESMKAWMKPRRLSLRSSNKLRENEPLEITSGAEHANRIFLIPAYRVHYVVCAEVERPMDERS
jgi:hypothetical protein